MKLGSKLTKRIVSGAAAVAMAVTNLMPSTLGTVFAANANDGYPIYDGKFEDSKWYTGSALGVAGDFHLFAFNSIVTNNHLNGNIDMVFGS